MNNIFIYYDHLGIVRERLYAPVRAGSSNSGAVYVYWEGGFEDDNPIFALCTFQFLIAGNVIGSGELGFSVKTTIPAWASNDLKYFSKSKIYNFIKCSIPDYVFATAGDWGVRPVFYSSTDIGASVSPLGIATFAVQGGVPSIGSSITTDQFGYLLSQVSGDKHFRYSWDVPSTEITINHNLNKYPSVSVVDRNGNEIDCAVEYTNENAVVLYFNYETTGSAFLN